MGRKGHIGGKGTRGSHTTIIEFAEKVIKIAKKIPGIEISPGLIKNGLRPPRKGPSVKIMRQGGCLFLKVRGNTSLQEVRIFHNDLASAENKLQERLCKKKIQIR